MEEKPAFINTEVPAEGNRRARQNHQRFFIQPHDTILCGAYANQIVVSHEQVLTYIQPTIDQFVASTNARSVQVSAGLA